MAPLHEIFINIYQDSRNRQDVISTIYIGFVSLNNIYVVFIIKLLFVGCKKSSEIRVLVLAVVQVSETFAPKIVKT